MVITLCCTSKDPSNATSFFMLHMSIMTGGDPTFSLIIEEILGLKIPLGTLSKTKEPVVLAQVFHAESMAFCRRLHIVTLLCRVPQDTSV